MIVKIFDRNEEYRAEAEVFNFRHLHEINRLDVLTGYTLEPIDKGEKILYQHRTGKWYEFIVDSPEIIHEEGTQYHFTAINSLVEIDGDWIEDKRPSTLSAAVVSILEPTRWTMGNVTNKPAISLNFYRVTAREALDILLESYPVEFQTRIDVGTSGVVTRTLDILDRVGGDYGKRFVFNRDLTSVKRTYRQGKVVTALYGFGKGEEVGNGFGRRIDFSSVNNGYPYVYNPDILAEYGRLENGVRKHVFDSVVYDDVEDKNKLLQLTQDEYAKRCRPQVSYEGTAVDLGLEHEQVGIGDTVKVIDGDHRFETRINYLMENEDFQNEVRLANYIMNITDSNNALIKKVGELATNAGVWDEAQKIVDGSYMDGLIDKLNDQANASGGWTFIKDGEGILTINAPTEATATKAVNIVGGTVRVASQKNPNGSWKWRTFITGDQVAADMISTGILKGGKVHWDLDTGVLYIGDSLETANLYWDGSNLNLNVNELKINAKDVATEESVSGAIGSATSPLITRISQAESKITPTAITSTVTSSSAYKTDLAGKEQTIIKQSTAPAHLSGKLWLDTSVTPNVLKRSTGSAWVKVTPTLPGEVGAYSSADGSALVTRISKAESKITPTAIINTVKDATDQDNEPLFAKTSEVKLTVDNWTAKFSQVGGENIYDNGDNFINRFSLYDGSAWLDGSPNFESVPEWGAVDAVRCKLSAGNSVLKAILLIANSYELQPGEPYTLSVYVKNNRADRPMQIRTNRFGTQTVEGGESRRVVISGIGDETQSAQIQLRSITAGHYVDVTIWRPKLEKGWVATDYNSKLYTGITRIDRDGVTVGREGETVETNLNYDGLRINDGSTEIASFLGSGAVITDLQADTISGNIVNTLKESVTLNVGSGEGYFANVAEALYSIGNPKHITISAVLTINIYGVHNDVVSIIGFGGGGEIKVNLHGRIKGGFRSFGNTCKVSLSGIGSNRVIEMSGHTIISNSDAFLFVQNIVTDCKNYSSGMGLSAQAGSNVYITDCELTNNRDAIIAMEGSTIQAINNKGSSSRYGLGAETGRIFASGTIPNGASDNFGFIYERGALAKSNSNYSPPATTTYQETLTFTHTDIYTYSVKYGAKSAHYGRTAAQNRYTTNMTQMKGRISFGSAVYSFISGRDSGTTLTVKMRLRRQNSTHGASSSVAPTPEWSGAPSFGGATRGNWTPWVTIPYTLFTSSGYTFSFYNGTTGNSYAIWDRAEVQITRTVTQ